jgi:dTDP-4-dehydrorhamnose 3,5-epimerase
MAIEVQPLAIPEVRLIRTRTFADHRGFFRETWNRAAFAEAGIHLDFVQDNHSGSTAIGTVRGLHFQAPPHAQDKLVRVIRGRILDVAVDLRRSSATFGQWVAAELSAAGAEQLLVPIGFAHGFCTLEADTEVLYKVSAGYAPEADLGIAWNDPDIGVAWPVEAAKAVLSAKDAALPRLRDIASPFA